MGAKDRESRVKKRREKIEREKHRGQEKNRIDGAVNVGFCGICRVCRLKVGQTLGSQLERSNAFPRSDTT